MRSSVRYTIGLMVAAGASLAFAGPASAAPVTPPPGYFAPVTYSTPNQYLGQLAASDQVVLNNVANPQVGGLNYNYGGSASASNYTYQNAGQSVGGLFSF